MASIGERLRLLADETRMRILHLLDQEPLTVAELQELLKLGQSSVSGHLSKMKNAQIIHAISEGASHRYRIRDDMPAELQECWESIKTLAENDPDIIKDRNLLEKFRQSRGANWVDSVAGSLHHHYTPGRNWHSLCQSIAPFAQLGICADIGSGDGSLLELLAPASEKLYCIEPAAPMHQAAEDKIKKLKLGHAESIHASAEAIPLDKHSCDSALLLQCLQYIENPELAINEAHRILKPGGRILIATLVAHKYQEAERYGHCHYGFKEKQIQKWLSSWNNCQIQSLSPEDRPPRFQTLIATATK